MAKAAWNSNFSGSATQQQAAALTARVPAALASGSAGAVATAARGSLAYVPHFAPRLDKVSGASGARVTPFGGLPSIFASTKDGFFNAGQTLRGRYATCETRFGHAPGFGWGRNVGFSATQPTWGWLERLGARVDLNRQSRRGLGLFSTRGDAWQRTGGMQNVAGTLFNGNFCLQLFRFSLPVDYAVEHTATLRRRGSLCTMPLAWRGPTDGANGRRDIALRSAYGQSGERPDSWWQRAWQTFRYGGASQQDFVFRGQLSLHTTRSIRQARTLNLGLNFDKFMPLSPLRLRSIHREVDTIDMARRSSSITSVKFERAKSHEKRLTLAAPLSQGLGYFATAMRMAIPQLWASKRNERKLSSHFVFAGQMQNNAAWSQLTQNWRSQDGVRGPLAEGAATDDALTHEFVRLSERQGLHAKGGVEAVIGESRREERLRLGSMLNFLPFRSAHVSPFCEVIHAEGSRSSLRDPNARTHLVAGTQEDLQRSHETFQEVSFEQNLESRLHARSEVRAHWSSSQEHALKNLSLRTVWTFNPRNEAVREASHRDVGDVVDRVNGLFGSEVCRPQAGQVQGERRISAAFDFSQEDLDYLQNVWAQGPLEANAARADYLDTAQLENLQQALRSARTGQERYRAVANFVTQARYRIPAETNAAQRRQVHLAPPSAQAAAWLRSLLPTLPALRLDVASHQHAHELERVKGIVLRYDRQAITQATHPHEIQERVVRVLRGINILDQLWNTYVGDLFYSNSSRKQMAEGIHRQRALLRGLLDLGGVAEDVHGFAHKLNHCGLTVAQRDQAMRLMLHGDKAPRHLLKAFQAQTRAPFLFDRQIDDGF